MKIILYLLINVNMEDSSYNHSSMVRSRYLKNLEKLQRSAYIQLKENSIRITN